MQFEQIETHKPLSFFKNETVFTVQSEYPSLRGRGLKVVKAAVFVKLPSGDYPDKPEIMNVDATEFPCLKEAGYHILTRDSKGAKFSPVNPSSK
jgi:hypothetical protein